MNTEEGYLKAILLGVNPPDANMMILNVGFAIIAKVLQYNASQLIKTVFYIWKYCIITRYMPNCSRPICAQHWVAVHRYSTIIVLQKLQVIARIWLKISIEKGKI
jgi:hypothetical protein